MKRWTKEQFEASCVEYAESMHPDKDVVLTTIEKSGGSYRGLSLKSSGEGVCISAVANLDRFYKEYLDGVDLKEIFDRIEDLITMEAPENLRQLTLKDRLEDYEWVKNRLFVSLVNDSKKKDKSIGKEVGDLFLEVRVLVDMDEHGIQTFVCDEDIMEFMKVSREQLVNDAFENSEKIMPIDIADMRDIVRSLGADVGDDEGVDDEKLLIVSNESKHLGASALFYSGAMKEVSKRFGGDVVLLPSSRNEWICLSAKQAQTEEQLEALKAMVMNVNETMVDEREWLSDEVYRYDAENDKFEVATA